MKKTRTRKAGAANKDDLLPEYNIDYKKARPNRFAQRFGKESVAVVLGPDIARVFTTPGSIGQEESAPPSIQLSGRKRGIAIQLLR